VTSFSPQQQGRNAAKRKEERQIKEEIDRNHQNCSLARAVHKPKGMFFS
jgi:hypothetical protein